MNRRNQLILYFIGIFFFTSAMGVHEAFFNNYLADVHGLTAEGRGWLEFPRELPGFLVVVTAAILCMLPVTQLAMIGAGVFAVGMVGMIALGSHLWPMVAMMMLASVGLHLLQPVGSSITLALSDENAKGRRMGQAGAIGTVGMLAGSAFVWLAFDGVNPSYKMGFLVAAVLGAIAACLYGALRIPHLHGRRPRFLVRKRYGLYYALEFVFGARKQIFITFGPWVLIQVYGFTASDIAGLLTIAGVIGIGFKPLMGWGVDRFGERIMLVADGLVLAVVCLGYGYAAQIMPTEQGAQWLASACLIADNLLFAMTGARTVYLSRITPNHEETTSTLATGISINHVVSMTIPAVAGAIWLALGYETVFLGAAGLALGISVLSSFVPGKGKAVRAEG